ncbi:hypothetical protein ALC56_04583, partial [Trachymyrmex septentrionalis]
EFTHFLWRKYGYVIVVNIARFLFDRLGIVLPLELLAGKPEGNVLLAVLAHEELSEEPAASGAPHQFVEGRAPDPNLLQAAALQTAVEAVESIETVTRTCTREVGDADATAMLAADTGVALFLALIARTAGTRRITADCRQTETRQRTLELPYRSLYGCGSHYKCFEAFD